MPNAVFAEDDVDLEKEIQESEDADGAENQEEQEEQETQESQDDSQEAEEPAAGKKTPRVPLPELLEERKKRQELEARLHESDGKYSKLEERLNKLNEHFKPKEPSFDDDPNKYLKAQAEQTGETIEELKARMEEFTQQNEVAQKRNDLTRHVVSAEDEFRTEHPDYDAAMDFLRQGRAREYEAMGMPAEQRNQLLVEEAYQLAEMAVRNGRSPAEMAYGIALARGYAAKPNGSAKKLDTIEKGQSRNRSLSNVAGGEERMLDAEALANMDDADFEAAMANGTWDKILRDIG